MGLRTLRSQALHIGTSSHGQQDSTLALYTNSIPLSSKSLFGNALGKMLAQAGTTSRDYKALGDCYVISGMSRPKPPSKSRKWKTDTSPPSPLFLGLLGLMAAMLKMVEYAHLHMHSIQ